jgi:hypothetical protein
MINALQEVITALVEAQAQGLGALVRVNAGEGTILISFVWHICNPKPVEKFVCILHSILNSKV